MCVTRFFTNIFSWFEPIWVPHKQTKIFLNSFWFRRDIRIFKKLRGVHHTTESDSTMCIIYRRVKLHDVHHTAESNSTKCIIPQSQTPHCASYTAESNSTKCIIPQSQTPQSALYRRVKLHGVHHTAESNSTVCITPQSQIAHYGVRIENFDGLWLLLKGQSGETIYGVNTSITKEKI